MPTYVYECPRCLRTREYQRPINERDDCTLCPWCYPDKDMPMRRLPAAPGFKLEGAGFHCNDYKKSKAGKKLYAEKP